MTDQAQGSRPKAQGAEWTRWKNRTETHYTRDDGPTGRRGVGVYQVRPRADLYYIRIEDYVTADAAMSAADALLAAQAAVERVRAECESMLSEASNGSSEWTHGAHWAAKQVLALLAAPAPAGQEGGNG